MIYFTICFDTSITLLGPGAGGRGLKLAQPAPPPPGPRPMRQIIGPVKVKDQSTFDLVVTTDNFISLKQY